ncbi:LPS assembly protein LptD [Rickettsiaceae bacterium]|nr:LPS assembly protein LptD [Rickettsiaceae bacterium]
MRVICKLFLILILLSTAFSIIAATPSGAVMKSKEVHYDAKKEVITASGSVFVEMDNYTLNADTIHYDLKKDAIFAEGNVRIIDPDGRTIKGNRAVFKDKLKKGAIEEFIARFDDNSLLTARLANRLDQNHVTLDKAIFTPCTINCGKKPIWQLNAAHTDIDYNKQKITYNHLLFEVYGLPIMYFPYFSHPTPDAPAQSGILGPKIKKDDFMLPFYFRVQPNLDATISPRFAKNHTIFEGQLRHKVKLGQYRINGSYGNPKFKKGDNNDSNNRRFHIFAKGDFSHNSINYGFNIKRASDKAYLTNHHEIYDSYLTSQLYVNKINERDYFSLESFYFQDLRAKDSKLNTPFVLPHIRTQHIYGLNDDDSLLLNVRGNVMAYREDSGTQLSRNSIDLEIMTNLISDGGHLVTLSAANRGDLYLVGLHDKATGKEAERVWYRNTPELRSRWRYPLTSQISYKSVLKLEPTAMVAIGNKYETRFNKFGLVDSPKNELSENNIFNANRFSGIDFHDHGNRLSYGLNSSLMSDKLYLDAFLGQLVHKHNVSQKGNSEYVGNVRVDFADNFDLFYRFRRDQNLKPILSEIGAVAKTEKFNANAIFTELHNVSRYFAREGLEPEENKISQVSLDMNYQLTEHLLVGAGSKIDISLRKARILTRTIRMTYLFDCVSINGAISDNFLHDSIRGVNKTRTKTFSIGLKVINM